MHRGTESGERVEMLLEDECHGMGNGHDSAICGQNRVESAVIETM